MESNAEDPQERKQADFEELRKLIKSYVGIDANISNAMRIGNRGAKTPLLKVTVGSTKEKVSILKRCTKFMQQNQSHPCTKDICITPDLTQKQQAENKAFGAKLKELNKSEKLYWIKNGEIVQRDPNP